MSTKRGRELANILAKSIGIPDGIFDTCSLLCRHAKTYAALQEGQCNGHPAMGEPDIPIKVAGRLQDEYAAWLTKREAQIEKRISELVASLPPTDAGPIVVRFSGDPRGCCVTLLMPDGNVDNWARDGICVPIRD
jgi:hypothetical protein